MDWLIYGKGEMPRAAAAGEDSMVKEKIMLLLDDMDIEEQREILRDIEKEKLLKELLAERKQKRA